MWTTCTTLYCHILQSNCTRLGSKGSLIRGLTLLIDPTAMPCWWAPTRAKQLSMAATARVTWFCACVRYWPYRGSELARVLGTVVYYPYRPMTATFSCPLCMVALVALLERFDCMHAVRDVVTEAEGRGGWHPRPWLYFCFIILSKYFFKFLTTKVSYKISALLTNREANAADFQFW